MRDHPEKPPGPLGAEFKGTCCRIITVEVLFCCQLIILADSADPLDHKLKKNPNS
jgi:hypothetical protein